MNFKVPKPIYPENDTHVTFWIRCYICGSSRQVLWYASSRFQPQNFLLMRKSLPLWLLIWKQRLVCIYLCVKWIFMPHESLLTFSQSDLEWTSQSTTHLKNNHLHRGLHDISNWSLSSPFWEWFFKLGPCMKC
jgi:hypothetical protein